MAKLLSEALLAAGLLFVCAPAMAQSTDGGAALTAPVAAPAIIENTIRLSPEEQLRQVQEHQARNDQRIDSLKAELTKLQEQINVTKEVLFEVQVSEAVAHDALLAQIKGVLLEMAKGDKANAEALEAISWQLSAVHTSIEQLKAHKADRWTLPSVQTMIKGVGCLAARLAAKVNSTAAAAVQVLCGEEPNAATPAPPLP